MIKSFELMDSDGYTYKVEIEERVESVWKFWNSKKVVRTYVGNSLGWYSLETGVKLRSKKIKEQLTALMRKDYLNTTYGKKNKSSHLTPIK